MTLLKQGFTLIECMLYCSAGATAIMAFMYYTSAIHLRLKHYNKRSQHILAVYGGIQHVIRSLETAPSNPQAWKRRTESELIYTHNKHDKGWCFVDSRLVFISGNFNTFEQQWLSKTSYPIISGLRSCKFTLQYSSTNQIESITLFLETTHLQPIISTIDLKLRAIIKKSNTPVS